MNWKKKSLLLCKFLDAFQFIMWPVYSCYHIWRDGLPYKQALRTWYARLSLPSEVYIEVSKKQAVSKKDNKGEQHFCGGIKVVASQ